jgi:hypothetical protein
MKLVSNASSSEAHNKLFMFMLSSTVHFVAFFVNNLTIDLEMENKRKYYDDYTVGCIHCNKRLHLTKGSLAHHELLCLKNPHRKLPKAQLPRKNVQIQTQMQTSLPDWVSLSDCNILAPNSQKVMDVTWCCRSRTWLFHNLKLRIHKFLLKKTGSWLHLPT